MKSCASPYLSIFFAQYIAPLASPLIALFVGIIAYRQWRTAQEKLRLDLYNRRFEVYSRTIDVIQAMMEWGARDPIERLEIHRFFIKAALESRFLFASDPSIAELLDEINTNSFIVRGFVEFIAPQASSMGDLFLAEYKKKTRCTGIHHAIYDPASSETLSLPGIRTETIRAVGLETLQSRKCGVTQ